MNLDIFGTGTVPVIDYTGHIKYDFDIIQGSEPWLLNRCGFLNVSEWKHIITPTLKIASNDKERKHVFEIAAQRITKYVEPTYFNDDMLRGGTEELYAREYYNDNYAEVVECGSISNDSLGFMVKYSPDGLVGNDGLIEIKSKKQYLQLMRILKKEADPDIMIQLQGGLWTAQRDWIDSITYCGGMNMLTVRVYPDPIVQNAMIEAACAFEENVKKVISGYDQAILSGARLIPTERRIELEMTI